MVWTKEWLINKIKYYRKLDFFEQYNHLSDNELADVILKIDDMYYQWQHYTPHYVGEDSVDWQFLTMVDRKRLLCVATDIIYGNPPSNYSFAAFAETLFKLANISRNIFCPQNIIEINENHVSFKLNDQKYEIDPQKTWHDPILIARQINPLIRNTSYQFEFWNLLPDIYIVLFAEEEKIKLINDGNWW